MINPKLSRREILAMATLAPLLLWQRASADSSDLKSQWDHLSIEQKELVRKRWAEFNAMPRERRDRLRAAQRRFAALSPEVRQKIRENWKTWQSMSSEQQEKVRANLKRFQSLSPERRRELLEKYQQKRRQDDDLKKKK